MAPTSANRARDPVLIAVAAVVLAVAALAVEGSLPWMGRSFPGFLVLENRVIASAGLSHWPATAGGEFYQAEIAALDGNPLDDVAALHAAVEAHPPGTSFRYTLRNGAETREVEIASRLFDRSDWLLLFGTYLFCGLGLCGMALAIRFLRGSDRLANGTFPALLLAGLFALTAMDLYGPYRFFRLHALCETLLAPAALHLALVFPRTATLLERRPRLPWLAYAAASALTVAYQAGLYHPLVYRVTHLAAQTGFGLGLAVLVGSQIGHWLRAREFQARQRIKVVALGSVFALGPQIFLTLIAVTTGVEAPQNAIAFSGMIFPLSIGYAVLHQNLLGVDEFVRRTLNYAALTLGITLFYAGAAAAFEAGFEHSPFGNRVSFALVFGPLSVLLLLPLRDRMQAGIDRLFFRTVYDFRRVVETASARLASVTDLAVISFELHRAVDETLNPEWIALYVRRPPGDALWCVDSSCPDPRLAETLLAAAVGTRDPGEGPDGTLVVPFRVEGALVAVLLLGRRLSGRHYGGDDRRLLHTLANQGAVAIENALALEQLRGLNRDLEGRVADRTRDLADALRELRDTQAQLVHREKMASVGQFVAGIAHEMNNPLAFIEGNLHFVGSYMGSLAAAVDGYEKEVASAGGPLPERLAAIRSELELDHVMNDLQGVLAGCAEGVTRATGLVRDLRTFSRLDQAEVLSVDLHEALDSTLNLLRSKLVGIEVVREYGELPRVECLAGQVNQIFMNLLANAADAVGHQGRIVVRTLCSEGRAAFEVEDNGCGIAPGHLERVFDPFFTTKEPGQGTGLGLAISYGIAMRHGGALTVRSEPQRGSCFRVELPVRWSGVEGDGSIEDSQGGS